MLDDRRRIRDGDRRPDRGAAVAEFAVVLPLLALILVGTVDFGRVMREAIVVEGAARAGAHYGAQSKAAAADAEGIRRVVVDELAEFAAADEVSVEAERYCLCGDGTKVDCTTGHCFSGGTEPWTYVRVWVGATFHPLFAYPGIPDEVRIARETHMRVQ